MNYKVGSINWFEDIMRKLGFLVVGLEVYHSSKIKGRIPRKNEPKNVYFFSFLITSSPEKDPIFEAFALEELLLRDPEKEIYELRFKIEFIPERHLLIPAAQNHGFEEIQGSRSRDYLGFVKNEDNRYLFEGS